MRVAQSECSMFLMYRDLAESHPFLDVRIGEAANLGPPDDAASRRDRTLHALAQMGLCRPAGPRGDAFGHS